MSGPAPISLEFEGESCETFARFVDELPEYGVTLYLQSDPETAIEAVLLGSAEDSAEHGFRYDAVRFLRAVDDEYDASVLRELGVPVETALVQRVIVS